MERLTIRTSKGAALNVADSYRSEAEARADLMQRYRIAVERLAAYEDTGLEPEDIKRVFDWDAILKLVAQTLRTTPDHLRELIKAEQDGRLVVLDEPMLPLIWGDDDHDTVLCPNCLKDLMGGFPDALDCGTSMYQCPYCGQSINTRKALTREEAKAALEARKVGEG